ncbi:hypothetical protein EX895_003624 [Sporisorium graminicola]|uniref:Fumarylacetoacetase-like C-terminal domain-containing protein n=1 Tax=Sporisorium graminicola TaxID=280036 RepID=A0A4U7KSG1_9BASI|nr:hypothetical protein EX895_003624 [Sporisorium graminicola]TKY86947.1 hypothetical protein EX895_003624 [Sporisorium graminicola]
MSSSSESDWKRLIRFVAVEDGKEHFGQPVDDKADIGLLASKGNKIQAYEIVGDNVPFNGWVDIDTVYTVKKLSAPIRRDQAGGSIRLLGANFKRHIEEAGIAKPKEPVLMIVPRTALAGPGDIPIPPFVHKGKDQLDYESELAVIIGKDARDVPREKAFDYVLGDWIFNVQDAISFLSNGTTLEAGTVIQMGTPSGVGWFKDPKGLIKDGDTFSALEKGAVEFTWPNSGLAAS